MNETNQQKAKKLRDVAAIFQGWDSVTKEGKYKNNRDGAVNLIQEGLEKAASVVPLINEMVSLYEILDHDPNPPHGTPHNPLQLLKQQFRKQQRVIGKNQSPVHPYNQSVIDQVTGENQDGFLKEYLLLASEMIHWAERLETEKPQAGAGKTAAPITIKNFIKVYCDLSGKPDIQSKVDLLHTYNRKKIISLPQLVSEYRKGQPKYYFIDDLIINWPDYQSKMTTLPPLKANVLVK